MAATFRVRRRARWKPSRCRFVATRSSCGESRRPDGEPGHKRSRVARRAIPSGRHQGTGPEEDGADTPIFVLVFFGRYDVVSLRSAGPYRRPAAVVLPVSYTHL